MRYLFLSILAILVIKKASALDFDFIIVGDECKMLISFNLPSDDALKVGEADKPILLCKRNSRVITCDITHESEPEKGIEKTFNVEIDTPPYLLFSTENYSDSVYINSGNLSGSFTSRALGENYLGHKVCSATFLTSDQYNLLQKQK